MAEGNEGGPQAGPANPNEGGMGYPPPQENPSPPVDAARIEASRANLEQAAATYQTGSYMPPPGNQPKPPMATVAGESEKKRGLAMGLLIGGGMGFFRIFVTFGSWLGQAMDAADKAFSKAIGAAVHKSSGGGGGGGGHGGH